MVVVVTSHPMFVCVPLQAGTFLVKTGRTCQLCQV